MALACDPIDLTVLKVLWNKRVLIRESQRSPIEFWSKAVPSRADNYSPFEKKALACLEDFIESERLTVCLVPQGANSELQIGAQEESWRPPGSTNCERVRIGQREKLNCDTVATEA